jgi:putative FmdB family regulatory protein
VPVDLDPSDGGTVPTYEYACSTCDQTHEVQQKMSDSTLTECPVCGQPTVRKLFTGVGVHFKGSGFYRTDSRSGAGSETSSSTAGSGTSGTSTTPAGSSPATSTSNGSSSSSSTSSSSTSSSSTS